jgi:diguanylate cyclase
MNRNPSMPAPAAVTSPTARDRRDARIAELLASLERLQAELARARAELAGTRDEVSNARHQALHDDLTRLPNGRFFRQRLDHVMARVRPDHAPLAVLYLDLDRFKPINDAYGHEAGDELLRIVAARLSRAVRSEDMVSRLGGDEFACLLSNPLDRPALCRMATKLFRAVSAPVNIDGLEVSVHPSIGIALCPDDGVTGEDLLKNADAAMYHAKRDRSGYAFVDRRTRQRDQRAVFDGVRTRSDRGASLYQSDNRLMAT